jgi:LmbE family N-acetylglucosaminyl deacetylase
MIRLGLEGTAPLRLLLIGAHSDDIEIGCGGTILSLLQRHPGSTVHWVVFAASGVRDEEARRSADAFMADAAARDMRVFPFPDGYLPYHGADVKRHFETLKKDIAPDVVFTHRLEDRHQDHRLLAELTWNTFRDHLVFEYEIPKYEGDLGHPNLFVPLSPALCHRKVALLMEFFGTQRSKRWFTEDLFLGLMRLRGIEAGLSDGGAEGFHCRKLLWNLQSDASTPSR